MKLGLGLSGPLADVGRAAHEAEAAGLESVWVAELEHSAFAQAGAVVAATSRVLVGTAVALAFPRSPTISAMEAIDLADLSGGRFLLGLGAQVPRILQLRFGLTVEHPAPQLAEYVVAVRAVFAAGRGAPAGHDGPFYRIAMPGFHGQPHPERLDPPVLIAAVGRLMARAAGSVADGLIGHPLASPRYLAEVVAPAVAEGAASAGRPASTCPISATVLVALDARDPERARREAKLQLAFYATTPAYRAILALHDREPIGRELRRAFATRERERMVSLIDDELLDAIAIAGHPAEARQRLDAWQGTRVINRAILASPGYGVDEARAREYAAAIVGTFGS